MNDPRTVAYPSLEYLTQYQPCDSQSCFQCNLIRIVRAAVTRLTVAMSNVPPKEIYEDLLDLAFGKDRRPAHPSNGKTSNDSLRESFREFMAARGYSVNVDDAIFVTDKNESAHPWFGRSQVNADSTRTPVEDEEPRESIKEEVIFRTGDAMTTINTLIGRLSESNMASDDNAANGWRTMSALAESLAAIEDAREYIQLL